jgi:hypothetical protein
MIPDMEHYIMDFGLNIAPEPAIVSPATIHMAKGQGKSNMVVFVMQVRRINQKSGSVSAKKKLFVRKINQIKYLSGSREIGKNSSKIK